MKKLLSFLVLMCVSLSAMASETSVKNAEGVDIWYDFDSRTTTASVTYKGSSYSSYKNEYTGEVVIPSTVTYKGVEYRVTSIGDYAFYYCDALTSITIPKGVTKIGDDAFYYCKALTSITIPEGVTKIGYSAFNICSDLTEVNYDGTIADWCGISFGDDEANPLYYAKHLYIDGEEVKDLVIPSGVTAINDYAFYGCNGLTSVTLPEGLTSIGAYAFYDCDALTNMKIPEGVTSIGNYAFYYCNALTSVTLPKSLTWIGYYAFYDCSALTSITIPEGVTLIGDHAFNLCSKLYEVYNKSDLTITMGSTDNGRVAYYAKNVYTDSEGESKLKTVGDYIFYVDGEDIELIAYTGDETSITLPADYEGKNYKIGERAFYYCSALTSITLPESLTEIGNYAFDLCSDLTEVNYDGTIADWCGISFGGSSANPLYYAGHLYIDGEEVKDLEIPSGVTAINDYAFYGCNGLTSVTLPEGVTSIGYAAFDDCTALTSITLPESLTSIGDLAFYNCYKLYEVYNKSDLTITMGSTDNGYVAYYAKNVYTDSEGESKLKTVGDYIFYADGEDIELIAYTGDETSITLPADYEGKNYKIGERAFYYCKALTSVTIPEGLTSIGYNAFYGCENLRGIINKSDLTITAGSSDNGYVAYYAKKIYTDGEIVGDYIFSANGESIIELIGYIGNETSITLPSDYEGKSYDIAENAFYECEALRSITLPEGVTEIGAAAFYGCSGLLDISLPASLENIRMYSFYECSSLSSIKIPEGISLIEYCTFSNCSKLESITLPSSLSVIDDYAFQYCSNLQSIKFPADVSKIGKGSFRGCNELANIVSLNTTPPTIGDNETFKDVDKTIPVYVPASSVEAYKNADYWSDFTNIVGAYFVEVTAENGTVEGAGAYLKNDEATLTATPAEGYKFVKWSDGVTDNPRTVVVTSDLTFTAEFELKEYTVAVTAKNGTVEGVGTYKHGAEATLTATPAEGYKFVQWSDGVTDNPRTIVVVSDATFTAEFELKEYTLTTKAENGTVKGAGTYKHGDEATLTATPAEGYKFVQWSDGVTDNPRTVVVVSDMTFTAEFEIDDTPISDIQTSDVNVRLIGNEIVVEGAEDYTVYSISGQNLGKVESVERGIYIVVVNGKSFKVVAK